MPALSEWYLSLVITTGYLTKWAEEMSPGEQAPESKLDNLHWITSDRRAMTLSSFIFIAAIKDPDKSHFKVKSSHLA